MFLFLQIPALAQTALISLIALLTLLGIMIRPYKISEAIIALLGAGLLLVLGLLSPRVALDTMLGECNTFFFILGMMCLSTLVEVAGPFDWLAFQAAQGILQEGLHYLPHSETISREGRPEQEIIQCVSEWHADLIVICPRSPVFGGPAFGPKLVGHVARFVLDRAPCPVLLLRQYM